MALILRDLIFCNFLLQDERLQDAMSDLRGKFKAIVAMTGMKDVYLPETQNSQTSMAF